MSDVTHTPSSYPIGTIRDMAAIPLEARERFLAELPAILDSIPSMVEALPTIAEESYRKLTRAQRMLTTPKMLAAMLDRQMVEKSTWIDDDKGTASISIRTGPDKEPIFRRSVQMGDRA